MITEYEPKLCPECNGSWMSTRFDWQSTNASQPCKLCWGTGKITITRIIWQTYAVGDKSREPPYKITY